MKRKLAVVFIFALVIAFGAVAHAETATPTASAVLVNGRNVSFDAYHINGNNYFKLRDLAFALSGTEKQFDVEWWEVENAIVLTAGDKYTVVGGEMAGGGQFAGGAGAGAKTATPTESDIFYVKDLQYYNMVKLNLTAYKINDNNYFKLRDIGEAFDFGVDWDESRDTISVDTGKKYTPGSGVVPAQPPRQPSVQPQAPAEMPTNAPADGSVDGNEYYTGVLHDFMKDKAENGFRNAVLYDVDGCGGAELIIVNEGKPEADDFWASYAIGFEIWVFDAKYPKNRGACYKSDEVTFSTYAVYLTKDKELVLYDRFEGEAYLVFKYAGGKLSLDLELVDGSYGWDTYFSIDGNETDGARFREKLEPYDFGNADNVMKIIATGHYIVD